MKLLIIGGTIFVGRYITKAALQNGHEVTLFNRGRQNHDLFPDIEKLKGDRNTDLNLLQGRHWDAVIDTSGYLPSSVQKSTTVLADSVERYVFISSISAYQENPPPRDENSPLSTITEDEVQQAETIKADSPTGASYGEWYGALKARCEATVKTTFPQRHLILRPGVIVGPYDYAYRLAYWIQRVARGGQVLAPMPETPVRLMDANALAQWIIAMVDHRKTGIYNAVGERGTTFQEMLSICQNHTQSDAEFVWATDEFLLKQQVESWQDLPLWLPKAEQGILFLSDQKAIEHGLTYTSMDTMIADNLAWLNQASPTFKIMAGMDSNQETTLLKTLLSHPPD